MMDLKEKRKRENSEVAGRVTEKQKREKVEDLEEVKVEREKKGGKLR